MSKLFDRRVFMGDLNASPFDRANIFLRYMNETEGYDAFDGALRDNLQLLSASISPIDPNVAKTVFTFRVTRSLCNSMANLHGGAVALIFDICTSMTVAPVVKEGFWDTGHVSRTLNCTYLRPAPEGSMVEVESEIVHMGRRMGMIKGVMKVDGKVCYTCEHGKAAIERSKM